MAKELFNFDAEFKLSIDAIDSEPIQLVIMINTIDLALSAISQPQPVS